MGSYLNRAWRLLTTGFSFATFFGGGAVVAFTVFPLIGALSATRSTRTGNTRYAIHRMFRVFVAMLEVFGILTVDRNGAEVLAELSGRLIIANHPTLLDVVLLMSLAPQVQCIVKHELWRSRYLGGVVRQAGYIRNDLEPEALIAACKEAMSDGSNLIIFPEGTRTRPGVPMHFHRGFANIALLSGAEIQTVAITCKPVFLTKGEAWWQVPSQPPRFRLTLGQRLDAKELLRYQSRPLAARALVRRLEAYYTGLLSNG